MRKTQKEKLADIEVLVAHLCEMRDYLRKLDERLPGVLEYHGTTYKMKEVIEDIYSLETLFNPAPHLRSAEDAQTVIDRRKRRSKGFYWQIAKPKK